MAKDAQEAARSLEKKLFGKYVAIRHAQQLPEVLFLCFLTCSIDSPLSRSTRLRLDNITNP